MDNKKNLLFGIKTAIVISVSILAMVGMTLSPTIPQDQYYHHFADQRSVLGIAGFWNVVSGIPFLIVGALGMATLSGKTRLALLHRMLPAYRAFFLAVFLVGLGSGYYHLAPSDATLVFDRLPMALAFMSLFAIIVSEFVSEKAGRGLFLPLLLSGLFSVGYWYFTELEGEGDLRLYVLVQFLPMLLIPLILLLFCPRFSHTSLIWTALGVYLLSKIAEMTDGLIYQAFGVISGHTLKHLLAALSAYLFLLALQKRKSVTTC